MHPHLVSPPPHWKSQKISSWNFLSKRNPFSKKFLQDSSWEWFSSANKFPQQSEEKPGKSSHRCSQCGSEFFTLGRKGCCLQFSVKPLLKRTLIAWLCGCHKVFLGVLLDPSGPSWNYITRPVTRVFLPKTISISIPTSVNNIRQRWEYRRWETPPGGGDVASGGHTHLTRA